ncbi:MAG TPA: ESX secretion-associated protein EspG [Pseudonocardiaceae bacterium]|nr:ESX secretion-associated protein EspG [Pseudonocardiaceae bacterium]
MHDTRTVELPVFVLINIVRRENLGEPPTVLAGGEQYVPARFEAQARRILDAELARAGVRSDSHFRPLLELITKAQVEYYGWIDSQDGSLAVLAAARGRAAVLVVRRGDTVVLGPTDANRLPQTVAAQLSDVPAARGPSLSVRAVDFSPARPAGGVLRQATAARPHQARLLDELLRQPRLGGARLYAATRDHTGTRQRSADSLTVLDVAQQGRWLVYFTAKTGDRAINVVPGPPATVAAKLADLLPRPGRR